MPATRRFRQPSPQVIAGGFFVASILSFHLCLPKSACIHPVGGTLAVQSTRPGGSSMRLLTIGGAPARRTERVHGRGQADNVHSQRFTFGRPWQILLAPRSRPWPCLQHVAGAEQVQGIPCGGASDAGGWLVLQGARQQDKQRRRGTRQEGQPAPALKMPGWARHFPRQPQRLPGSSQVATPAGTSNEGWPADRSAG
jgi:hypothetical protein